MCVSVGRGLRQMQRELWLLPRRASSVAGLGAHQRAGIQGSERGRAHIHSRHRRHVPVAERLVESGGLPEHILHKERPMCVSVGRGMSQVQRELWLPRRRASCVAGLGAHERKESTARAFRAVRGGVRTCIFVTEDTSQPEMSWLKALAYLNMFCTGSGPRVCQ